MNRTYKYKRKLEVKDYDRGPRKGELEMIKEQNTRTLTALCSLLYTLVETRTITQEQADHIAAGYEVGPVQWEDE